jgi:uncharacterized membrane protein YphA (DoxX/SURF4 family)
MIRVSLWTAFFLVLLRVCIGWHFLYEGAGKVKSAYEGKAAVNDKPFSSEAYFRESEGPFGKLIKRQLGDPDQEVVDRLTLKPVDGDASRASPISRFPAALEKEWDDYFDRFGAQYRLDDQQKAKAQGDFNQSKANYVKWVQGISDKNDPDTKKPIPIRLKVKRKAPGANPGGDFEEEVTVAERAAEFKKKSDDVKAVYENKLPVMGKDVEGANLRAMKAEVATIRNELRKEIDDQTKGMKDKLAQLFDTRLTAYAAPIEDKDGSKLQAMLTPMKAGTNPLAGMWDEYASFVKDYAPNITDAQKASVDTEVSAAKERFDRWLADRDMYTGAELDQKEVAEWRKNLAAAEARKATAEHLLPTFEGPKSKDSKDSPSGPHWRYEFVAGLLAAQKADAEAEIKALRANMQADLKSQSDSMRAQVGTPLLGEERAKGYAAPVDERLYGFIPKSWGPIEYLDWTTRWFLTVVGALLMVGLFTRLSCFAGAGFLLLTILTQPSLPWLPTPPNQEGNYLIVNKNVIEMVALLVLMTTRSGQWAGLDGLVSWLFGGRRRESATRRPSRLVHSSNRP